MRFFPGLLLLSILLSGCASLTEDQCAVGEWAKIGTNDAIEGLQPSRLSDHEKACKRYNILPDHAQYMKGYRRGLVTYCTPSNGFNVGRNGYSYRKICPRGAEPDFLKGYTHGSDLHAIEVSMAEVKHSLGAVRKQIGEMRTSPSKEKRRAIMRLYSEENRLKTELARLERDRDIALLKSESFLKSINPDI